MVLAISTSVRRLAVLTMAALVAGIGIGVSVGAPNDEPLIFGSDAGVVLTFVRPDKTADFEQVLDRFRIVLEDSDDPIRRQQAENWLVYRSPDPGPNNSVLYVSFLEPVLRGANYNIANILAEELTEEEADTLLGLFEGSLSQAQSAMSLKSLLTLSDDIPAEPTDTEEESNATP